MKVKESVSGILLSFLESLFLSLGAVSRRSETTVQAHMLQQKGKRRECTWIKNWRPCPFHVPASLRSKDILFIPDMIATVRRTKTRLGQMSERSSSLGLQSMSCPPRLLSYYEYISAKVLAHES